MTSAEIMRPPSSDRLQTIFIPPSIFFTFKGGGAGARASPKYAPGKDYIIVHFVGEK